MTTNNNISCIYDHNYFAVSQLHNSSIDTIAYNNNEWRLNKCYGQKGYTLNMGYRKNKGY